MNEKDQMDCEKLLQEYFYRKNMLLSRAQRIKDYRIGLQDQLNCMWNLIYDLLLQFNYIPVTDPQKCEIVWDGQHYKYEVDDYGQQIVVIADGHEFGCGAYNDLWDIDIIYVLESYFIETEVQKIIDSSEK